MVIKANGKICKESKEITAKEAKLSVALNRACHILAKHYCPRASRCKQDRAGCAECIKNYLVERDDVLYRD